MLDCLGLSRKRIALPAEEMPDNVEVLILGTGRSAAVSALEVSVRIAKAEKYSPRLDRLLLNSSPIS